jgi:hypothetical protein
VALATDIDHADERRRRREARRRQVRRRRLTAATLLVLLGAASVFGLSRLVTGTDAGAAVVLTPVRGAIPPSPFRTQLPEEIRGVHVTGAPQLAVEDGAAVPYFNARSVAREAHAAGVYLIGRVVSFEDPITAVARPALAVRRSDGGLWKTSGGLAWLNPYSRAAWRYDLDVAVAGAKAGFDEIQFDYVRFPSDGDLSAMRFPGPHQQARDATVPAFLRYAVSRLHPLGVRVSADVFGLSATRDLGIGQHPAVVGKIVDAVYPMTYPSHYNSGEYNLPDPNAAPGATVTHSLRDFRAQLAGARALLVPWLQDFSLGRTYTAADVQAQIAAARAASAGGFMLWNGTGLYTAGTLRGGAVPALPALPAPQL